MKLKLVDVIFINSANRKENILRNFFVSLIDITHYTAVLYNIELYLISMTSVVYFGLS